MLWELSLLEFPPRKKDLENPEGKIVGTIQFRGVVLNAPGTSKLPSKCLKLH